MHEEKLRIEAKHKAIKSLKNSEQYVLLILRKNGPPACFYDVSKCTTDGDVRHEFLKDIAKLSMDGCENVRKYAQNQAAEIKDRALMAIKAIHENEQSKAEIETNKP